MRLFHRSSRLSQRQIEERCGYICILPWLLGFIFFTAAPMVTSLYLSFTSTDMLTPPQFVGFQNYKDLLSFDENISLFWRTLYNTTYYAVFSVLLNMALGLFMAILLNQPIRGLGIFRTIFYLPSVLSGVAVALLWVWLLNPEFGLVNYLLSLVGITGPRWIYDELWSKPALILMSAWGAGGSMLIYLAGLQGIPTQLYEAAEIDGANSFQKFFKITLPMLSPTIFFVLVTSLIGAFQTFVTTYVMTGGGPANSTLMYVLYLYRVAFQQFRMGFGSALAWLYFVIIAIFTVILFKTSSWVYYEKEVWKA